MQFTEYLSVLREQRRRVAITLLVLVVFRLLAHIPVVSLDSTQLAETLSKHFWGGLVNLLSGGGMLNGFSFVAGGLLPFMVGSMVSMLVVFLIPSVRRLLTEEDGAEKIASKMAKYETAIGLIFAISFAIVAVYYLDLAKGLFPGSGVAFTSATLLRLVALVGVVAGGMLLTNWLSDVITKHGIGHGKMVMILSGACLLLLEEIRKTVTVGGGTLGSMLHLATLLAVVIISVFLSIYLSEGKRQIPIQYGKHVRDINIRWGRLVVVGGQSTHWPIHLIPYGLEPFLMVSSFLVWLLITASAISSMSLGWLSSIGGGITVALNPDGGGFWVLQFVLVVGLAKLDFRFYYQPDRLAALLWKQGAFIGSTQSTQVRPGINTELYLEREVRRNGWYGALGLGFLTALLPLAVKLLTGQYLTVEVLASIVVTGIIMSFAKQAEVKYVMEKYKGFIRGS